MEDHTPPTEPSGALVPPPIHPPTAIGADAAEPTPPSRSRVTRVEIHRTVMLGGALGALLGDVATRILDGADRVAEDLEYVFRIR